MPDQIPELTRKGFLRMSAVVVGGIALAGCDVGARGPSTDDTLDGFLTLSRLVTGIGDLPDDLAPRYLAALDEALPLGPSTLIELAGYTGASGPATLDELEASPALSRRGAQACADAVAAAWWSGMTPTKTGETQVVTYLDALVWRALPHAQPPSNCLGATGAWAAPGRDS